MWVVRLIAFHDCVYNPAPVSYTHLDVYKRQGIIGMDLLNKLGATIHCKERILEINKVKTGNISACNNEIKIATKHLTNKETNELLKLCNAYRDIFKKADQYLSCTITVKHEIPVDLSQTPINQRPYSCRKHKNR